MRKRARYTPKKFGDAVTRYFRRRNFNEKQYYFDKGSEKWLPVMVEDEESGGLKQLYLERYARPVSLAGLCNELQITKEDFEQYSANPRYRHICDRALAKIEAYLTESILEGHGSVSGIKFVMQNSFDMKENIEIDVGGGSLSDRMKIAEETIKKMKSEDNS